MTKEIQDYLCAKNDILNQFGCIDDYPIKPLTGYKWRIYSQNGIYFISYWNDEEEYKFAIAKKQGEPLIFENDEYSMVVAIDCIKIAFVFKNIYRD